MNKILKKSRPRFIFTKRDELQVNFKRGDGSRYVFMAQYNDFIFGVLNAYSIKDGFLVMEKLGVRVTDDGYTRIDENARPVSVATEWRDLGAFADFLAHRLTGTNVT